MNRRAFLKLAATAGLGAAMRPRSGFGADLLQTLVPRPAVDNFPEIQHFVLLMMENHSFDNVLGTLDRPGVDGFTFDSHRSITNTNPDASGNPIHAFHLPTT